MKKEISKLLSSGLTEKYKDLSSKTQFQADKMVVEFENGSIIEIRFDTLKADIKENGAFLLSYSLTVNNSEIFSIKEKTQTNSLNNPLLWFGKDLYILPENMSRHDRYTVSAAKSEAEVVDTVISDFDEYVLPLGMALSKDYAAALSYFDNKDFLIGLKDAYATAIIMALLTKSKNWLAKDLPVLVDKYSEGPLLRFYDYRRSPDPQENIFDKITGVLG
jgi:hypothetical protein